MGFKGDLRNIGLSDVFQNIASNRLGGTLRIYDEKDERYIFFTLGEVAMASRGKQPKAITKVLVREGKISEKDHGRLVRRQAKSPKGLPELLGEMKIMKPEDYRASVRRHVEEEIYEVFAWRTALFEFTEGEPAQDLFDSEQKVAMVSIPATSIIMEAARRLDEWEKINRRIPTPREIVIPTSPLQAGGELASRDIVREILEDADGRRSVQWMVDNLPHTKFEVCKAVSDLLEAGVLRPLTEFERVKLAETLISADRQEEALEIYRFSLEVDRNDHDMRRKYVNLLESMGHSEEAASEVKILAHLLLEGGNPEGAIGAYQRAVGLTPTDIVARERLYALWKEILDPRVAVALGRRRPTKEYAVPKELKRPEGVVQAGRDLAQLYRKVGLTEKARDVYLELGEILSGVPDLGELLARTYLDLGETQKAVDRYFTAARLHFDEKHYDEAAEICERIIEIDPEKAAARRMLDDVRQGRIARRKHRMRRAAWITLGSLLGLAFLAGLVYEAIARRAFHRAHLHEVGLLRNSNVSGAIEKYLEVAEGYPGSPSSVEARAVIARLAGWQIEVALTPGEILEIQELDLPDATRARAEERFHYLSIHVRLGEYARMTDGERQKVRGEIAGIRNPRAAEAILLVHREIRGKQWSPEINEALLKAMDGINDKNQVPQKLLAWLEEIDQDYGENRGPGENDRRAIRRILTRLTGRSRAITDVRALGAPFWRQVLEEEGSRR